MTPERLAEIRALCEAATPGPWYGIGDGSGWLAVACRAEGFHERTQTILAFERDSINGHPDDREVEAQEHAANTEFIAASRTAVPELIAEVERLKERNVEISKEKIMKDNQKYIIRCARAGVFYGEIAARRGDEADLANVRRVHGWDGACSLSQLATEGVKKTGGNNRWSVAVPQMTVLGVIEIIPVSDEAQNQMDGLPVWKS